MLSPVHIQESAHFLAISILPFLDMDLLGKRSLGYPKFWVLMPRWVVDHLPRHGKAGGGEGPQGCLEAKSTGFEANSLGFVLHPAIQ